MYDFPKQENWKWDPITREYLVLDPGEREELWDKVSSGWLYWVMVISNSPDVRFRVDMYADKVIDIDVTIRYLNRIGFLGTGSGKFLVTKYDETNNLYVAQYTPLNGLGVPFRGRNVAFVENNTDSTITVELIKAFLITLR